MGAGSHHLGAGRVYQDAARSQRRRQLLRRAQVGIDVEPDQVGLDLQRVQRSPGVSAMAPAITCAFLWSSARRST